MLVAGGEKRGRDGVGGRASAQASEPRWADVQFSRRVAAAVAAHGWTTFKDVGSGQTVVSLKRTMMLFSQVFETV